MHTTELAIRAARETALAHGITPDRCDILQNGSTLVLRLTDTLVARVVQDRDGPRQGTEWFARENAIALHLTQNGARDEWVDVADFKRGIGVIAGAIALWSAAR